MFTINLKMTKSDPTLTLEEFTNIYNELDIVKMFKIHEHLPQYSIDSVESLYEQYSKNKNSNEYYWGNFNPDINMYYTFDLGRVIITAKTKGFTVSTTSQKDSRWGSELKGTTQKIDSTINKFYRAIASFTETREKELSFSNTEKLLESLVKEKFSDNTIFRFHNKYNEYIPTWNIQFLQNNNWIVAFNATLKNNILSFSKFEFNIPTTSNILDVSNTISNYMNILNSVM